jgi:hypothetical protein
MPWAVTWGGRDQVVQSGEVFMVPREYRVVLGDGPGEHPSSADRHQGDVRGEDDVEPPPSAGEWPGGGCRYSRRSRLSRLGEPVEAPGLDIGGLSGPLDLDQREVVRDIVEGLANRWQGHTVIALDRSASRSAHPATDDRQEIQGNPYAWWTGKKLLGHSFRKQSNPIRLTSRGVCKASFKDDALSKVVPVGRRPTPSGLARMKYTTRGYEEAEAEALRIAETFVAVDAPKGSWWAWECSQPEPDQDAPGFNRRMPIVKWRVWVRPKPTDGSTIDGGDGYVLVDIHTKEAHWSDWPA